MFVSMSRSSLLKGVLDARLRSPSSHRLRSRRLCSRRLHSRCSARPLLVASARARLLAPSSLSLPASARAVSAVVASSLARLFVSRSPLLASPRLCLPSQRLIQCPSTRSMVSAFRIRKILQTLRRSLRRHGPLKLGGLALVSAGCHNFFTVQPLCVFPQVWSMDIHL